MHGALVSALSERMTVPGFTQVASAGTVPPRLRRASAGSAVATEAPKARDAAAATTARVRRMGAGPPEGAGSGSTLVRHRPPEQPFPSSGGRVGRTATVSRVQLTVVDHPLARARLSRMRDERTDNANFRAALRDLTQMLVYEATREQALLEEPITTPVTGTTGYRLAAPPLIVPVLRAGLGMADTAHRMLPESQMGFVGLARNEETFQPEAYMASLPESLVGREVFVLDPMLATGGSLVHCCGLLTARGTTSITVLCALAAPDGLRRLEESGLPLRVFTASVDEKLNDKAYIVPGLGDAGDRQFGAV